jgi:hypothetical protein
MFFESRFFAHIMPVVFVFAAAGVEVLARRTVPKLVWGAVLLLVSVRLVGPLDRLVIDDRNGDPKEQIQVAMLLKKNARPTSSVAVITAGLVPYFTRLPALDILGRADRHVARLTPFPGSMVGHGKQDPEYTLGRRPDLVISCRSRDFAMNLTADTRTTDPVASFLAAHPFRDRYLANPIQEPFLLENAAVYTHEGSPEAANRAWSSVTVAP